MENAIMGMPPYQVSRAIAYGSGAYATGIIKHMSKDVGSSAICD